jgi:hypothetical protein
MYGLKVLIKKRLLLSKAYILKFLIIQNIILGKAQKSGKFELNISTFFNEIEPQAVLLGFYIPCNLFDSMHGLFF